MDAIVPRMWNDFYDIRQPPHASRRRDGDRSDPSHSGVHSTDEPTRIGRFRSDLFAAVKTKLGTRKASIIASGGSKAADETATLRRREAAPLFPTTILETYVNNSHRVADIWADLRDDTVAVIADGCLTLASLWESVWAEGGGSTIAVTNPTSLDVSKLEALYQDATFAPSMHLPDMVARTDVFG
ncbi:hypothetical protein [Paludisphaera rhizosphaerae]|uniref:hypothetical protein n=1 Tax=Paludisphaera rhizosphaerae TaxID=2711216 RepID=UPI001C6EDDF6|nr:hypothetical protein [Paludisphaera rhizosphaerae]